MKIQLMAVFVSAMAGLVSTASASITSRWNNAAGGMWSVAGNWINNPPTLTPPPPGGGAAYTLEFLLASSYTANNDLDDSVSNFRLNRLRLGGGAVTLSGRALQFLNHGAITPTITNDSAVSVAIDNAIVLENNATVGTVDDGVVYLRGNISGPGALAVGGSIGVGAGAIVLTGNNSYSGGTTARIATSAAGGPSWRGLILSNTTGGVTVPGNLTILAGMVRLGADEQIGDAGVISAAGRFMLLGRTETVAGIVGSGFVQNTDQSDPSAVIGPATLILAPPAGVTHSFAGFLRNAFMLGASNTLNIVKKGDGAQIFSGGNIGHHADPAALGLGEIRVEAGALTLTNTTHGSFRSPIDIAGTGRLFVELFFDASRNRITNNVANGLAFGLTNIFRVGGLSGSGAIELRNRTGDAVALIVSNHTASVYSGNLSGAGSLVKIGAGDLVLSGNNTYTGTTLFTNGLARVTRAAALPGHAAAGRVTVGGPLELNLGGTGWTETEVNDLISNATFTAPAGSRMVLDVAAASTIAIMRPLTMGPLEKRGDGTLRLQAGNTYGGGTRILGGALVLSGNETALGAAGTPVTIDGARLSNSSDDIFVPRPVAIGNLGAAFSSERDLLRFVGVISNDTGQVGSIRILGGGGGVVLTGENRYTGGTTVEPGAHVAIHGNRVFGDGLLTIRGGTIRPTSAAVGFTHVTNAVTLAGDVTLGHGASAGDLRFLGAVTLTGGTRTVRVEGAWHAHIDGIIGDGGHGHGLIKTGTNTLYLRGANTYTGGTTIEGGTLRLSGAGATLGAATGAITVSGGALDLGGLGRTAGAVTISGGTISNGTLTGTSYAGHSGTVSAILAGAGVALTKTGAGALTLLGANTYSGGTTILAGELRVGDGGTTGALGAGAVLNNGALTINRSDTLAIADAIGGTGSLTNLGAGTLVLLGANIYAGGTTIHAGTIVLGIGGTSGTAGTGGIDIAGAGATLAFNRSDTYTPGNVLSGAGGVAQIGLGGATILNQANTFAGTVNVMTGMLVAAHNSALGTTAGGTVVHAGATLGLPGGVTIAGETLTLSGVGATAFTGALRNVAGNNEWAGTIVAPGTADRALLSAAGFLLVSGNVEGSGTGGNLLLRGDGSGEISGVISGTRPIFLSAAGATVPGTWTLSGENTYNAATIIAGGTLQISKDSNLGVAPATHVANRLQIRGGTLRATDNMVIHANRGITMGPSGGGIDTVAGKELTVNSAIAGVAGNPLIKLGGGTLRLAGANTYAGTTTVQAGLLLVNNTHVGGANYSIESGGTLGGTGVISGNEVLVKSGGAIAPGNSIGALTVNALRLDDGAVLRMELSGHSNASDRIALTGNLIAGNDVGGNYIFDFMNTGFWDGVNDTVYTLLTFGSGANIGGIGPSKFQVTNLGAGLTGAVGVNDTDITLTVIPEPGSLGTLGILALAAILRRRLRR